LVTVNYFLFVLMNLNTSKSIHIKWTHIFPILIKQKEIIKKLFEQIESKQSDTKNHLIYVLNQTHPKELRKYSQKVFEKVYELNWMKMKDEEVQSGMKMFQTAFVEMAWLFGNINRKQKGKRWFDHLMWVLDNFLEYKENPTIEQCVVCILHDSIEEIKWYTKEHISKTYNQDISNSVNVLTKKPKWKKIKEIKWQNKYHKHYNWMIGWDKKDLEVKMADRLNSLQTMEWTDPNYIRKKIKETEKYFLIPEIEKKVWKKQYEHLKSEYYSVIENMLNDTK